MAEKSDKIVKADTSQACDMIWCIADLYNTEKHLAYSIIKNVEKNEIDKAKKLALIYNEIRIKRTRMEEKLVNLLDVKLEYDSWCCVKHVIGALMQSTEVAIREQYKENYDEAIEYFKIANSIWEALWILLELGRKKS
jgi:hypothetical protein